MVDARNSTPLPESPANAEQARPPLSGGRLAAVALLGLVVLGTVFVGMWFWINSTPATGEQKTTAHLEVFKTTASVAVMLGGIGALYLAARRQRTQETEHAHAVRTAEINRQHAERVAAATEDDAARRRVTELYTKAADQLGSGKAPVRLAGLYALERLGQDNPDQRQTIANLWCAYLRMPYSPPPPKVTRRPAVISRPLLSDPRRRTGIQRPAPATATPTDPAAKHAEAVLERDVRLSVQRLLAKHLHSHIDDNSAPHPDYWPEIVDLDLTEATLINLNLSNCVLPAIRAQRATFTGHASFRGATFTGDAEFSSATFTGDAKFHETIFTSDCGFRGATFTGDANFQETTFTGGCAFGGATFADDAWFDHATFTHSSWFEHATFSGNAWFVNATFTHNASFDYTTFIGDAWFVDATFTRTAGFDGATFTRTARFDSATFTGGAGFRDTTFTTPRFGNAVFASTPQCRGALGHLAHAKASGSIWPSGWTCIEAGIRDPWGPLVPVPVVTPTDGAGTAENEAEQTLCE